MSHPHPHRHTHHHTAVIDIVAWHSVSSPLETGQTCGAGISRPEIFMADGKIFSCRSEVSLLGFTARLMSRPNKLMTQCGTVLDA